MLRAFWASASSFMARNPPMLTRPSFLALMVAPSARSNISRAMSLDRPVLAAPARAVLMN